jgi:hypothetical protein
VLGIVVLLAYSVAVVSYAASGAHLEVSVHSDAVRTHSHGHLLFVELRNIAALGCRRVTEPKDIAL